MGFLENLGSMASSGGGIAGLGSSASSLSSLGSLASKASPWGMALQAAPAVAGLLFGENNIFSGKARQASRELGKAFEESQNTGINQGYYDVLAGQRARAQQGMGQASKALAFQQNAASTNAALAGADSGRARLAAIQGISRSGNNLALNLAVQNEGIQRQNQAVADTTATNVAGLEDANWQRKMDERNAYWGGRKEESNAAISSNLAGLGTAVGQGIKSGVFNKKQQS